MTYSEALSLVGSEFELLKDSDHSCVIRTGLTYDGCNGFCVVIYKKNDGKVVLTDMGETKEIFDEVSEEEWNRIVVGENNAYLLNGEIHFNQTKSDYEAGIAK